MKKSTAQNGLYSTIATAVGVNVPRKSRVSRRRDFFTPSLFGKKMALNDIERKAAEETVGAFIEKHRPLAHVRPELDLGFRVSGQSVELFEIRPRWKTPQAKWNEHFTEKRQ